MWTYPAPETEPTAAGSLGVGPEMALSVVLVPVTACDTTTDASALVDAYSDAVWAVYPATTVDISVRDEPVEWEAGTTQDAWVRLLAAVQDARATDDAEPHVFYIAAVPSCAAGSIVGLAYRPGSPKAAASARWRVSAVIEGRADTFVHELGHNLGRRHVTCSGSEGTPDPDYPHDGGAVGHDGWDAATGERIPADVADYMSYCDPVWVSDYGWAAALDVLAAFGEWDRSIEDEGADVVQ
jgi:hypothetical protein